MKYLLMFSFLLLAACDGEPEDLTCVGEAENESLAGNWVRPLVGNQGDVTYKLVLNFGEAEDAWVTYSCQNRDGVLASVRKKVDYVQHSPEQFSLGYSGLMNPVQGRVACGSFGFGGQKYNYELKGPCLVLNPNGEKIKFEKGL